MRFFKRVQQSPARLSILGFMALISVGTCLLMLPLASAGKPLGFVDALFTATSASCVTGLIVVDTGRALSVAGQLIVLALIQAGGLGIMTITTLFLMMAGIRPSLTGRILLRDTFTHSQDRTPGEILKEVILFTLAIESLGAGALFLRFANDFDAFSALYLAIFHSISAFCNAGFSLFSDSLVQYREDFVMNLVVWILIVSGGMGFLTISELRFQFFARHRKLKRLSLHSKLVLSTTGILLLGGFALILMMEWHNSMAPLTFGGRILSAVFQSVTARTAGFNTLDIGSMANETLFVMILLMFVGASPGSCGGGIKTTSMATIVLQGLSRLRGHQHTQAFHRTIPEISVAKAVSVVLISITVVVIGGSLLLMSELGEISHQESRGKFLELLFEVVSAFGTVGLSMGVTATLSAIGKLIITAVMFIGRLGPLVIAIAVSTPRQSRFYYAEEPIMVG
jgi:trk system potassium uptake protein TrkH